MTTDAQTPCYDRKAKRNCPNRKAGCAASCKEWAEYVRKRDAQYEKIKINIYAHSETVGRRNLRTRKLKERYGL